MDETHLARLATTPLFRGIRDEELPTLLGCLAAHRRTYDAEEAILRMGDTVRSLGIVLAGGVRIERADPWGNTAVLGFAGAGDVFAESYACAPDMPLLVNVVAAEPTEALFLDVRRIATMCPGACAYHGKLLANLLAISARKNIELSRRTFHTSPKTMRGKLLSYLSAEATRTGSRRFTIPFNRQQLANYLGVDRSALSSELSRMQRDGLIKTRRSDIERLCDTHE